jgi:hypothetical protein
VGASCRVPRVSSLWMHCPRGSSSGTKLRRHRATRTSLRTGGGEQEAALGGRGPMPLEGVPARVWDGGHQVGPSLLLGGYLWQGLGRFPFREQPLPSLRPPLLGVPAKSEIFPEQNIRQAVVSGREGKLTFGKGPIRIALEGPDELCVHTHTCACYCMHAYTPICTSVVHTVHNCAHVCSNAHTHTRTHVLTSTYMHTHHAHTGPQAYVHRTPAHTHT